MRLGKALAVGVAEDVEAVTSAEGGVAVPETVAECEVPEPVSVEVPERHPVPAGR
ncbi:hypothetical protein [Streptomyces sp. NRRL F-5755]|uniref:hypothetical protein n=1 Tax=Streptomyces sp. NRRL F-5755 TaxID=1519475 RepID=UPI000AD088AD|nr:hypothetical protein [Streptomyces sp. NRRL F-5755]